MIRGRMDGLERPRLVIPMMMVWVARNVVHSGLIKQLVKEGVDPVLLTPEPPPEPLARELRSLGVQVEELLSAGYQGTRFDWLMNTILSFAIIRRTAPDSYSIRRQWYERYMVGKPKVRYRTAATLSWLFLNSDRYEWLRNIWENRNRRRYRVDAMMRQLAGVRGSAVWFNFWGMGKEAPYVAAARTMGLPILTSIISFDNVLTKGVRPGFDHYLVWSDRIGRELLARNPRIEEKMVSVVGTPQFDFHRQPDLIWSREKTLERLGLSPEKRFFLYGAGREYHSPGETDLVADIAALIADDPGFRNHEVVVRLHPLDNRERWRGVIDHRQIVVSEPFDPCVDRDGWSWSSLEDQALLVSSLFHADACLSVASTIAVDAAIVGTPAIGIRLKGDDGPRDVYFDAFDLEHYRPLVESGGVWMARSWTELLSLLSRAVEKPDFGRRFREKMVEDTCGFVDGRAAVRTVAALVSFLDMTDHDRKVNG